VKDRTLVLGHRGFHATVPENTLAAFSAALDVGADGFETDVRMSADGLPVLFHNRTTADGRDVSSLTREQLSHVVGYDVPTLPEAVARWPDAFWNIEVKTPRAFDATLAVVRQYLPRTRFLVSSFWHPVVAAFSKVVEVNCGVLVAHHPLDVDRMLNDLNTEGRISSVVFDCETVNEILLDRAKAAGIMTFVYGPKTEEEHSRLLQCAVTGVITDSPPLINQL
jgi:glycerophosphoryl diester phosphodiesterase